MLPLAVARFFAVSLPVITLSHGQKTVQHPERDEGQCRICFGGVEDE